MSSIPEDLQIEILKRLPVKLIIKCKSVCKSWLSLISNPYFVKKHFDFTVQNNSRWSILFARRYAIYSVGYDDFEIKDYDDEIEVDRSPFRFLYDHEAETKYYDDADFEIVDYPFKSSGFSIRLVGSSCNGLFCIMFYERKGNRDDIKFYCIWNPATREFKKIPVPPENHGSSIRIYAFGYDCQNDDYKLLILSETHSSVFTLGLNLWKSFPVTPYDWWTYCAWDGVLVNGKLHWLAMSDYKSIVSLDISNEEFEVMQLRIEQRENKLHQNIIHGVLEGFLCVLVEIFTDDVIELWVMEEHGVPESWTKRHTVTNKILTMRISIS